MEDEDTMVPSSVGVTVPPTPDSETHSQGAVPGSARAVVRDLATQVETSEEESDEEAAYQEQLTQRDSMWVWWRRSPPDDATRKRILQQIDMQQVSRSKTSTTHDDQILTQTNNSTRTAGEYGCARGGGTTGLSAAISAGHTEEPEGHDSGDGGTGHNALNPTNVALGSSNVVGHCMPVDQGVGVYVSGLAAMTSYISFILEFFVHSFNFQ